MKTHRIAAYVIAAVAVASALSRAQAADEMGRVSAVLGSAKLVKSGTTGEIPLKSGDAVCAGDRIITETGARAHIEARDGSIVQIAGGTEVEVSEYTLSPRNTLLKGRIRLMLGKLWATVERLPAGSEFCVETGNTIAGVRGTQFALERSGSGDDAETRVYVFKGEVYVRNTLSAQEIALKEGGWVKLAGPRMSPVEPLQERMMNSVKNEFRASSVTGAGIKRPESAAAARERTGSAITSAQTLGSPEVQLRTDYISPRGLTVPPSSGVIGKGPQGSNVPQVIPAPPATDKGVNPRTLIGRDKIMDVLR